MVRCFGVSHSCVRVLGVPIACPIAMTVVRRRFHQHIVARTIIWRDMTGDGIAYDFEYALRTAAVYSDVSMVNAGDRNTGYQDVVGRFSAHYSLPAFETAWVCRSNSIFWRLFHLFQDKLIVLMSTGNIYHDRRVR